jgi:hypothetical protein
MDDMMTKTSRIEFQLLRFFSAEFNKFSLS